MKTGFLLIYLVLIPTLLLAACSSESRVSALQTEFQSVELGDDESVRVEIEFGAGDLQVSGGAEKLLEADFTYNVAKLKPEVEFSNGTLSVRQPGTRGLPGLQDITDFRNEWSLQLNDDVPVDIQLQMGAGTGNLQLASLPLTGLDVSLGAGEYTIDLSGGWARDLTATIDSGAADITVRLPKDVGARVEVEAGPTAIDAPGFNREGNVFTNDAYGVSDVTVDVTMEAGVGRINLEVEEAE